MKNVLRRHRITILVFALAVSILIGTGYHRALADDATTPPAQVIISSATITDQGVDISWIAGQPGTNPIGTYVIQKRGQDGEFSKIDQVSADSLSYIDTSGQEGDAYKVIAEDNQDPAIASDPSDPAIASAQEPGSSVAVIPPDAAPAPDSVNTTPDTSTPSTGNSSPAITEGEVEPLQNNLTRNVTELDSAISKNDTTKSTSILNSLQGYHQQILTSFPRLTAPQKQTFTKTCQQQLPILEPALLLLPESSESDGLTILAGCEAIQGLSQ